MKTVYTGWYWVKFTKNINSTIGDFVACRFVDTIFSFFGIYCNLYKVWFVNKNTYKTNAINLLLQNFYVDFFMTPINNNKKPIAIELKSEIRKYKEHFSKDYETQIYVYNKNRQLIGMPDEAFILLSMGIEPMGRTSKSKICTIGYCELTNKWYGWGEKGIMGFALGDKQYKNNNNIKTYGQAKYNAIQYSLEAK